MAAASGSKHHLAKLDEKKVRAIRAACAAAKAKNERNPLGELAAKYGISTSTVAAVANGRTWAHVL